MSGAYIVKHYRSFNPWIALVTCLCTFWFCFLCLWRQEYNISETVVAPSQDISKKSTDTDEDEQGEEDADVNVQRKGSHSKASLQK